VEGRWQVALYFNCKCGSELKVPDDAVGKKVKCPSCGRVVIVPSKVVAPLAEIRSHVSSEEARLPIDNSGSLSKRVRLSEPKTSHAGEWGVLILVLAAIVATVIGFTYFEESTTAVYIGTVGLITLGVILATFIGLIPGYIARGKQRHRDIRRLGFVGIVIPVCWIVAFIWAFVDKPLDES